MAIGGVGRALRLLQPTKAWRREELATYRARCLQAVVRHAAERVPYYRRLLETAGVDAREVRTPADLGRLPLTSRRDIQGLPAEELVARGLDPSSLMAMLSSGSSGEPFTTRRTRREHVLLLAFRLRAYFEWGGRLRDRSAGVWWAGRETRRRPLHSYLGIRRGTRISCLQPTETILAELRGTRFDVLCGLPVTLAEVAELLTDEDRAAMRPRFIHTSAESSTVELRRRLAEAFSAPVYDQYGTNEFNMTAWQCADTGLYHVADPAVILEVLDEDGRPVGLGEEGEVVGTALHAYAMPLIRYRLDDLAVRGPATCPCGAPWSTLERIVGRVPERFVMPSGERLHPYHLQEAFMPGAPWVQAFQIVQERLDLVRLRLRPLPGRMPDGAELRRTSAAVQTVMGTGVTVTVEVVDEIPRGARRKGRPYVCLVG